MMNEPGKIVAALDIGTSKTVCLIGRVDEAGKVAIIGYGVSGYRSKSVHRGVLIRMASTEDAVLNACEKAQAMANVTIDSVYVGVSGAHLECATSEGTVTFENSQVNEEDIARVMAQGSIRTDPVGKELLHVLPQEFVIDDSSGIQDPLGMTGSRMQVKTLLVFADKNALNDLRNCVANCGLKLSGFVARQLASSLAVVNEDEKDLGVAMVDIGAGTSDIAIYTGGAIRYIETLPIAGDHLTSDLSISLITPSDEAEKLKCKYGCTMASLVDAEDEIKVASVGKRPPRAMQRQTLAEVLGPRYEELFEYVSDAFERSGCKDKLLSGVILTGGSAQMEGAIELAAEMFQRKVSVALPIGLSEFDSALQHPSFSTAVGLLHWGANEKGPSAGRSQASQHVAQKTKESLWDKVKRSF
ncbi:MAG: cell division protein FtsA [Pontibacterium sp.]